MPELAPKVQEDLATWTEDERNSVLKAGDGSIEAQLVAYNRVAPQVHRRQGDEYRKANGITASRRVRL